MRKRNSSYVNRRTNQKGPSVKTKVMNYHEAKLEARFANGRISNYQNLKRIIANKEQKQVRWASGDPSKQMFTYNFSSAMIYYYVFTRMISASQLKCEQNQFSKSVSQKGKYSKSCIDINIRKRCICGVSWKQQQQEGQGAKSGNCRIAPRMLKTDFNDESKCEIILI